MPYIGNTAANRFVASKAASVFSGDGSTTAFTLDHGVGSDEDILVSVDGVIQEPSVAYSVSGTTLTFTAAPSSNSGNNIFVYYLFRTVGTVSHPSSNALEATSGTFTSTLDVTGETTLATHLNMGDADRIKLGTGSDLQIYHDGTDSLITNATNSLKLDSNAGTSIKIDAFGHVTKPLQPAFQARPTSTLTNVASETVLAMSNEIFDQNSDYNTSTYTFTAPETGKYQFNVAVRTDSVDHNSNWQRITLDTSNHSYASSIIDLDGLDQDPVHWNIAYSVLADMDANDTASIKWWQSGGSTQVDISTSSYFSGYLAC